MKTIYNFINEKLVLNKQSQIGNLFSQDNVLFVPFSLDNFCIMKNENKYKQFKISYSIGSSHWTIFVIPKKLAYEIYLELPNKKLSSLKGLYIFIIPDDICSSDELINVLKNSKSEGINAANSEKDKLWKSIDTKKQLQNLN